MSEILHREWVFDGERTSEWRRCSSMLTARHDFAAVVLHGDVVLVTGGRCSTPVELFTPPPPIINRRSACPRAMEQLASSAISSRLCLQWVVFRWWRLHFWFLKFLLRVGNYLSASKNVDGSYFSSSWKTDFFSHQTTPMLSLSEEDFLPALTTSMFMHQFTYFSGALLMVQKNMSLQMHPRTHRQGNEFKHYVTSSIFNIS